MSGCTNPYWFVLPSSSSALTSSRGYEPRALRTPKTNYRLLAQHPDYKLFRSSTGFTQPRKHTIHPKSCYSYFGLLPLFFPTPKVATLLPASLPLLFFPTQPHAQGVDIIVNNTSQEPTFPSHLFRDYQPRLRPRISTGCLRGTPDYPMPQRHQQPITRSRSPKPPQNNGNQHIRS
jgi:hypothetical protein